MANPVQGPASIFRADGLPIFLGDIFQGRCAFLVAGGPSFSTIQKDHLNKAGFITMGLNNSVKTFRPNLWCSVDNPKRFLKSIWYDPAIWKFVPHHYANETIFDNEKWADTDTVVSSCPSTFFYVLDEHFDPENFLFTETMFWGDSPVVGGGRSVMLPALKLLFYCGIRHVFLLGVDFDMDEGKFYHFPQDRSKEAIRSNCSSYRNLAKRFSKLQAHFLEHSFQVFNCNPHSKLTVFPFIPFEEAVDYCTQEMPPVIASERSEGLYERTHSSVGAVEDSYSARIIQELPRLVRVKDQMGGEPADCSIVLLAQEGEEENMLTLLESIQEEFGPVTIDLFGLARAPTVSYPRRWCSYKRMSDFELPRFSEWQSYIPFAIANANCSKCIFLAGSHVLSAGVLNLRNMIGRGIFLRVKTDINGSLTFGIEIIGVSRTHPVIRSWCERLLETPNASASDKLNAVLRESGAEVVPLAI